MLKPTLTSLSPPIVRDTKPSTVLLCVPRQRAASTVAPTGSAVAAASDIHRQMPTHMADIRRDWLTNQVCLSIRLSKIVSKI